MRKFGMLLTVCFVLLCFLPALAEESATASVRITCPEAETLSVQQSVAAQVELVRSGKKTSLDAQLRLNDPTMDRAEQKLPQKSLRVDSGEMSFVLYNDGFDALATKVKSAVCCSLIAQGPVPIPVCAQEPAEVYLNGEYLGLYTLREPMENAAAAFEGLDGTAGLQVADGRGRAVFGDASGLKEALQQAAGLDLATEEGRRTLQTFVDPESFLNCLAVNAYIGNANIFGELFFYRVNDGAWKSGTRDFAFALVSADDRSVARLTHPNTDTPPTKVSVLAQNMLAVSAYRDLFLTQLGKVYQSMSTPAMQAAADVENTRAAPALPAHMTRWADAFIKAMSGEGTYPVADEQEALLYQRYMVYRLRDKTMVRRPWSLYDGVQREFGLTDEEMASLFGAPKPELPEVAGDSWEEYKKRNK